MGPRGPACHLEARGRLAGRDRWISLPRSCRRNQVRVTPNTRNDPTQNSLADCPVANLTKSLKTFCCHFVHLESLSINHHHHHQPTLFTVAALRLGNLSTQSISSGCLILLIPQLLQSQWLLQRHPPARPRSMPSSRRLPPAPLASSAVSSSTPDSPSPVPSAAR